MKFKEDKQVNQLMHIVRPLSALGVLIFLGTMGYMFIEDWNFLDSLFMSVTTLTTVGYEIVNAPLSYQGRVFTIFYIVVGVILFLYLAAEFAEYFILVNFGKILSKRKMEKKLKKIKNHYIVCGYGRTGIEVVSHLEKSHKEFVIVDSDPSVVQKAQNEGFLCLLGDVTDDSLLEKAGVYTANSIFCCLSDDADNLYLTLSVRSLYHSLKIVSRCVKPENEKKFLRAGVDKIVLPYEISGSRMVSSVLKPSVHDFLEVVMHANGSNLEMLEFKVEKGALVDGLTLDKSGIKEQADVIIVAVKRDGDFIINPSPFLVLKGGDLLIVLAAGEHLSKFKKLIA